MGKTRKQDDSARVKGILDELARLYPEADCELRWSSPFELLCATILSAQCTDVRVNMVTPELFRRWPGAHALAQAQKEELEEVVRSTGFFRNKAKNLIGMARVLAEKHDSQVPRTMEEMLELPGVARKTANVVLGTAFGLATGVVVDTHVQRLSQRLGLSKSDDPKRIEQDLMEILPRSEWICTAHQLIWHGRRTCDARKPRCDSCALAPLCPSADVQPR
ncbi:MAG: endonuclease III [Deltaproteobacteria bacterium]|nr:endonuclease III [Deltaproteobacteria bacterium]